MSMYSITELMALQGTGSIDIGQFTIYALESRFIRGLAADSQADRHRQPATPPENRIDYRA